MRTSLGFWKICLLLGSAPMAAAAADNPQLDELRAEVAALAARVAALEAENRELREGRPPQLAGDAASGPAEPAPDLGIPDRGRFRLSGDFRYRYEEIALEGTEEHQRSRIRARAAFTTDIADNLEAGFGLATGGDSPTSSTQTLGAGGSKKDIALDLAYVAWQPRPGLHVLAGKFRNPLFQVPSQTLLWDDEWRPEGVAVRYENERMFATVLGTWLESDSLAPAREFAAGAHAGVYQDAGPARLTAGLGWFDIGTAGKGTFYGSGGGFLGNSRHCGGLPDPGSCTYLFDYREVEAFAAVDVERPGYRAKLYGHYVENLDAERSGTGWTAGTRLHTAWRDQPLRFDYFYRSVGADAVFAQLTNSDFGGGGSDAEGHYFRAGWAVRPGWELALTLFDNETGADAGAPLDYDRIQLDANFSYD